MIKNKNILIIISVVLVSLFLMNLKITQAIYHPEDIDDNVIKQVIEIAEEYNDIRDRMDLRKQLGYMSVETDGGKAYGILINTPYFVAIQDTQDYIRRYQEPDKKELRKTLESKFVSIQQVIFSDSESDVKEDDLHLVFEVPVIEDGEFTEETEIIQPSMQFETDSGYYSDMMLYFGGAMYGFAIENLPRKENLNKKEELLITAIHIYKAGEARLDIDLNKIDLNLEKLEELEKEDEELGEEFFY